MKYVPPFGFPDETPYVDTDLEAGIEGSPVPAAAVEHTQREVVNAIRKAGLTPDANDLEQLGMAISMMIQKAQYELCEFYYFRHPSLRPGFQPAQGGVLADAATRYPEAWAYLQTTEGRKLCTSEAEWQSMTRTVWHTNFEGMQASWNGIGGAPFYAPDYATGSLRLPDLRGMYAEAAGFDNLGVGDTHGDGIRNLFGALRLGNEAYVVPVRYVYGAFSTIQEMLQFQAPGYAQLSGGTTITFDISRAVPTANKNQPRAWGALPCVYLGLPQ